MSSPHTGFPRRADLLDGFLLGPFGRRLAGLVSGIEGGENLTDGDFVEVEGVTIAGHQSRNAKVGVSDDFGLNKSEVFHR